MHIQNIHKKYGSLVAVLPLAAWKFLFYIDFRTVPFNNS